MTNARVESASRQAVAQRNYRRARDRALARLAQKYPNVYRELYEEEKERDKLEGKKWNSITDSPIYGVGSNASHKRSAPTRSRRRWRRR